MLIASSPRAPLRKRFGTSSRRKARTIADVLGEEGFARSLSKTDLEYLFSED